MWIEICIYLIALPWIYESFYIGLCSKYFSVHQIKKKWQTSWFNFHITNFSFLSSNINFHRSYDVIISQHIRYAGACTSYVLFSQLGDFPVSFSNRDTSWNANAWNTKLDFHLDPSHLWLAYAPIVATSSPELAASFLNFPPWWILVSLDTFSILRFSFVLL